MEEKNIKICCVTGASGYIGSCLVKKLLEKDHIVHATVKDLDDEAEVGVLKKLPGAETRLKLFQADLFDEDSSGFASAIGGCNFVFHLANTLVHNPLSTKYKDTIEAIVGSAKNIVEICAASTSVKKIIYTSSDTACSPLVEDGSAYKDFMDESCWTPLNISHAYGYDFIKAYMVAKTLTEKEILKQNDKEESHLQVVSLVCALVGGRGLTLSPSSPPVIVSPLTGYDVWYQTLKFLQALLGSVPLIHLEDVCEAHLFCMENDNAVGRILCAPVCPTLSEIIDVYRTKYATYQLVEQELEDDLKTKVACRSTKLEDMGFKFKYHFEKIIDDTVEYAKELGLLPTTT